MALLFTLHHSNKENEHSSLNGTASSRRRRTAVNPYSQPLPFNHNERMALKSSRSSTVGSQDNTASRASTKATASKASNDTLATIEEETSPTIRRILEATGCSSRQELLALRAAQGQQVNTNGSRNPNASKSTNGPKTSNGVNSSISTNGSKAAPNVAKNVAKSTLKRSASTNPKKKSKGMYLLTLILKTRDSQ